MPLVRFQQRAVPLEKVKGKIDRATQATQNGQKRKTENLENTHLVLPGRLRDSFGDLQALRVFEVHVWFLVFASGLPSGNLRGSSGTAVF